MQTDIDRIKSPNHLKIIALIIIAIGLFTGCGAKYGVLRTNPEVTATFKSRTPDPDYTYYYYRNAVNPKVIIGIDKDYTLTSDLWIKVDPERVTVERLLERLLMSQMTTFYGANLISPDGKIMGVWFSASSGATIKMRSEYEIEYVRPWPVEAPEGSKSKSPIISP